MAIALSNDTLQKLLIGYKRFHIDTGLSLVEAYERTLVSFFSIGENHNGRFVATFPPFKSLPTFRQFEYRGKIHYSSDSPNAKPPRLSAKPLGRRPNYLKWGYGGYEISPLQSDKSDGTTNRGNNEL